MRNLLRNMTASNFNQRFPVGTRFKYYPVPGIPDWSYVTTRSEAWHVKSGRLVVRIEGMIGGLSVNRLEPVTSSVSNGRNHD
ncbi:TPA: hypothetical protein MNP25_003590 [Klebsiella pneumoniae]|uniref:hypothetical protein n=1 Tax=Klebsiella pneumoniae TaxID=573 RepID=UPI0007CC357B|nr:hypothetical protein [Klebsiella pneumoniae]EKW9769562.1 hypothetical protein [Klebsiella pneumoniae]EKZ5977228.1 hypothetical protein [Klebsiella pneumoniae]MBD7803870.1 hypothetical protein [Klebsiella pneumoniae]QLU40513.1 hypothetical protein HV227_13260 [Klebsiella pneumoniae]TXX12250.1 hypothetical protein D4M54_19585 [Klebsiella pneumoniae]